MMQLRALLEAVALCNDAQLVPPDAEETRWRPLGDPTEVALLTRRAQGRRGSRRAAQGLAAPGGDPVRLRGEDDGHAARDGANGRIVFLKGAPEMLLGSAAMRGDGDAVSPIDEARVAMRRPPPSAMAERALRVLAVAVVERRDAR